MPFAWRILRALLLGSALAVFAGATGADKTSDTTKTRKYGAREVAAMLDMQAMRDAETIAYLDTNYLHTLENLNDILGAATNYYFDDIMDLGGAQVISLLTARFRSQRLDVRRPPHVWLGPYVTFQQGKISIDGAGYDPGTPIDPWGNPYYFFTPLGLVRPTLGTVTLDLYGDAFDRYAIVSLGSDSVMSGDDLMVFFGAPPFSLPTQTVVSSVAPTIVAPGRPVTIRGYNFGDMQGESLIELAGQPVETVTAWTDREISFTVPPGASSGPVVVVRGTRRTEGLFRLHILNRARHWSLYR